MPPPPPPEWVTVELPLTTLLEIVRRPRSLDMPAPLSATLRLTLEEMTDTVPRALRMAPPVFCPASPPERVIPRTDSVPATSRRRKRSSDARLIVVWLPTSVMFPVMMGRPSAPRVPVAAAAVRLYVHDGARLSVCGDPAPLAVVMALTSAVVVHPTVTAAPADPCHAPCAISRAPATRPALHECEPIRLPLIFMVVVDHTLGSR